MQYLLLIYNEESGWAAMSEERQQGAMKQFGEFTQGIIESGNFKSGNRLMPVAQATTVRVRDGKRSTTDGPFAETKEQLGGYYVIEAADLDEAIDIAAKIPSIHAGSVEVRPIAPM